MAAPTRGMEGGRLDVAAAGAAEKRRDGLLIILVLRHAAASNLEDWPLQRVAARSKFMVLLCCFYGFC